jgi:hypothetical protein
MGGPSEQLPSQKAIGIKLIAIHWAVIELWKERCYIGGWIKLQRYFNKSYLKILRIFCKMLYTFELYTRLLCLPWTLGSISLGYSLLLNINYSVFSPSVAIILFSLNYSKRKVTFPSGLVEMFKVNFLCRFSSTLFTEISTSW